VQQLVAHVPWGHNPQIQKLIFGCVQELSLVGSGRIPVFGNRASKQGGTTGGAGFQTCRPADFPIGIGQAGLETRETADLEVCATKTGMRTSL
jgi:hypothetical protein